MGKDYKEEMIKKICEVISKYTTFSPEAIKEKYDDHDSFDEVMWSIEVAQHLHIDLNSL